MLNTITSNALVGEAGRWDIGVDKKVTHDSCVLFSFVREFPKIREEKFSSLILGNSLLKGKRNSLPLKENSLLLTINFELNLMVFYL